MHRHRIPLYLALRLSVRRFQMPLETLATFKIIYATDPHFYKIWLTSFVGGAVASWLVHSTPKRAVRVRALAGDIVLCSWARHFTLTVPLSTQVYRWVPANLMLGGNPAMDQHPIQEGVEILLVASCYRNRDKLRPGGPHWPVCRLYLFFKHRLSSLTHRRYF